MKLLLQCQHCIHELGIPGFQPVVVQINDERFFKMTCPKGHETITVIQQPKHEILFELGMNALVDSYSREAVTAFASSLESFYEFCIKQILKFQGVDEKSVETGWKSMAKQSERQLGAFILLWLNSFGVAPSLLGDKSISFRNKVVHQGYIPTPEEAVQFGEDVVICIRKNLQDMKSEFVEDLENIFLSEFLDRASSQEQQVATMSIVSTIDWSALVKDGEMVDLRERLTQIEKDKVLFQWEKR